MAPASTFWFRKCKSEVVNYAKSATTPSQQLEHLGFLLDSANMTVSLTQNKREKLKNKCRRIVNAERNTIREVAELIGI